MYLAVIRDRIVNVDDVAEQVCGSVVLGPDIIPVVIVAQAVMLTFAIIGHVYQAGTVEDCLPDEQRGTWFLRDVGE